MKRLFAQPLLLQRGLLQVGKVQEPLQVLEPGVARRLQRDRHSAGLQREQLARSEPAVVQWAKQLAVKRHRIDQHLLQEWSLGWQQVLVPKAVLAVGSQQTGWQQRQDWAEAGPRILQMDLKVVRSMRRGHPNDLRAGPEQLIWQGQLVEAGKAIVVGLSQGELRKPRIVILAFSLGSALAKRAALGLFPYPYLRVTQPVFSTPPLGRPKELT